MGSWNTIATSSPRMSRSCPGVMVSTSRPASFTEPVMSALPGSRPMAVALVTDLPEPDSPTRATTSPGLTSNVTPLTACTSPNSVANFTSTSRKASTGSPPRSSWRATTPIALVAGPGGTPPAPEEPGTAAPRASRSADDAACEPCPPAVTSFSFFLPNMDRPFLSFALIADRPRPRR